MAGAQAVERQDLVLEPAGEQGGDPGGKVLSPAASREPSQAVGDFRFTNGRGEGVLGC
jgi:hypothetical protein